MRIESFERAIEEIKRFDEPEVGVDDLHALYERLGIDGETRQYLYETTNRDMDGSVFITSSRGC